MRGDLSDISLWVAGETGQAALALSGDTPGLRAAVDQHAATLRDALGEPVTAAVLMSYARGFVEAAVARGWWPVPGLDWESLRLAAVCRLFLETQGLTV